MIINPHTLSVQNLGNLFSYSQNRFWKKRCPTLQIIINILYQSLSFLNRTLMISFSAKTLKLKVLFYLSTP